MYGQSIGSIDDIGSGGLVLCVKDVAAHTVYMTVIPKGSTNQYNIMDISTIYRQEPFVYIVHLHEQLFLNFYLIDHVALSGPELPSDQGMSELQNNQSIL